MEVIQMAHAGTMDLGQTTKAARGGNPWLVVAVMVAIVVATLAVWFATGSGLRTGATGRPAADNTYPMEALRGAATLSADTSYDQIEKLRIAAGRGPLVDESYNAIEKLRGGIAATSPSTVTGPADYRYSQLQKLQVAVGRGPQIYADDFQLQKTRGAIVGSTGAGQFDAYDHAEKLQAAGLAPAVSFAGNPAAALVPGSVVSGGSGVVVPGPYSYLQLQQMHITAFAPAISSTSGTFHVGNPQAGDPIAPLNGIKTIDNPVKRDRIGGQ
jgi:hypothetical protein